MKNFTFTTSRQEDTMHFRIEGDLTLYDFLKHKNQGNVMDVILACLKEDGLQEINEGEQVWRMWNAALTGTVPERQSFQLWVKSVETGKFHHMGYVRAEFVVTLPWMVNIEIREDTATSARGAASLLRDAVSIELHVPYPASRPDVYRAEDCLHRFKRMVVSRLVTGRPYKILAICEK